MSAYRFAAVLVLVPALASAADNPFLGQAKGLYVDMEFEKCTRRLEQASRWTNTQAQLAEIELFAGLCILGLGDEREAIERFEMALKLDGSVTPPQAAGPKVLAVFEKAKKKVGDQAGVPPPPQPPPEPPPVVTADAPKQVELAPASVAAPEVVEAPPPKPLRLVAPLSVGGVGIAAAIAGAVLGAQARGDERAKAGARFESEAFSFAQSAQSQALAANICFAVAAAAAVTAVVIFLVQN